MIFFKHIRITFLISIVLTIIIVVLSTVLSLIFIHYIQKLGEFTVDVNSNNIRYQTRTFIEKAIDLEVIQYSTLFEQMENYSRIFATHISDKLDSISSNKNEEDKSSDIKMDIYNGEIYYNYRNPRRLIIIPKPLQNGLPEKYKKKLSVLCQLDPLIMNVVIDSISIHNMWIITSDMITIKFLETPVNAKNNYKNWKNAYKTTARYLKEYSELGKNKKETYWTKIHKSYSGVSEISVITPMYDSEQNFLGLVGISVHLQDILDVVLGRNRALHYGKDISYSKSVYNFFPGSFSFIIDKTGEFIAYPANKSSLFSLPPEKLSTLSNELYEGNIKSSTNRKVCELADVIIKNKYGQQTLRLGNQNYMIVYKELFNSNWNLATVIPEYDFFASIRETESLITKINNEIIFKVLLFTILIIFIFILFNLIFFRKLLLRPLIRLCRETWGITANNLVASVKEGNTKEINTLAKALNDMSHDLNNHIEKFKEETENRQKIESEVRIAAEIQKSLLPKLNENFQRSEFDISTGIHVTDKASKCFYDFFYLNQDTLVFSIADITEKGIPAAFYMGMTKTLIKNICFSHKNYEPGEVLMEANKMIIDLSSNINMYVSIFLAFYNIKDGILQYANTGVNVGGYYLKNKTKSRLKITSSSTLGQFIDAVYENRIIKMSINDKIVLFARELEKFESEETIIKTRKGFEKLIVELSIYNCETLCKEILEAAKTKKIGPELETAAMVAFEKKE